MSKNNDCTLETPFFWENGPNNQTQQKRSNFVILVFLCFCVSSASSTLQSDINPNYGGYSTDYGRQHWSPYPGFLCPSQVEQTQTHVLSTHFLLYEAFQTRSPSQIVLNTGNVDRWNLFVHWGFEILKDHGEWLSTISTCTGDLKLFYRYKHMQVLSQQPLSLWSQSSATENISVKDVIVLDCLKSPQYALWQLFDI